MFSKGMAVGLQQLVVGQCEEEVLEWVADTGKLHTVVVLQLDGEGVAVVQVVVGVAREEDTSFNCHVLSIIVPT